jgi:hypothetical protein
MNNFLKVSLCVIGAFIAIRVLPVLMVPLVLGGLALLLIGGLLFGGVVALAGSGLAALAVLLVLGAALAPIWIPILAVVGLVSLLRRGTRTAV